MIGQLNLFKGKRQRGTKPPPPREFALHCAVADTLRCSIVPGWRYTHIPLGEYRTPATAGRLKRMGVVGGFPDFMFLHIEGRVCFLELKRRGEKLNDTQASMASFLRLAGHGYEWTDDYRSAVAVLQEWGVVRAGLVVA